MPTKGFGGAGVFSGKGAREINLSISICPVALVKLFNRFDLTFHEGVKGFREEGGAVFAALAGSNVNELPFKIKISDAQADAFH